MTDSQLATVPLDEPLRDAVLQARRIRSRSAGRRQRQLIGKLMRHVDDEPIRRALEALARNQVGDTRLFHEAERWRERLVREGSAALAEFSAITGRKDETLQRLVADLPNSPTAALARHNRRELFRRVHAELGAMQNDRH